MHTKILRNKDRENRVSYKIGQIKIIYIHTYIEKNGKANIRMWTRFCKIPMAFCKLGNSFKEGEIKMDEKKSTTYKYEERRKREEREQGQEEASTLVNDSPWGLMAYFYKHLTSMIIVLKSIS